MTAWEKKMWKVVQDRFNLIVVQVLLPPVDLRCPVRDEE